MTEPTTDAEIVEASRREMQAVVDRTDFSARTQRELSESPGLPHLAIQFAAADLTELGRFDVELPPEATAGRPKLVVDALKRHWVYRYKDGRILTLQLSQRVRLRTLGYVQGTALVNDTGSRS
jgi:hypothetical protein